MTIAVSDVFSGLITQQLAALISILGKANDYAKENNLTDKDLLATRLHEDMHPLSWQIQTSVELIQRGISRLTNQEPVNLVLDEPSFDKLILRIQSIKNELSNLNSTALNESADVVFEIPVGPDASLPLKGKDYVLKFMLPNVYFHLTTTYDLLRMKGVPVGKRDFMGPF
ncbi:DUF1993 domain-containing protein [Arenicella sp. 4NH20-0111]|uniref:DUF1993 domain-containing protein n=1 Tax=Arenicella sp. 4NH20-0111 TaxID=3127648 RepID=UPI00310694D6